MRFHVVELHPRLTEVHTILIAATSMDINIWIADVAALGKYEQRWSREQPPAEN